MMRTASETLGTQAGGLEFVAKDGLKHKVSHLTLGIMGKFEKWMESRALQSVVERKSILGDSFQDAISAVSNDIVRGKYAFNSSICNEAMASAAGIIQMTALMLGVDEIRAKWLIENQGDELVVFLNQMIKESVPEGKVTRVVEGQ